MPPSRLEQLYHELRTTALAGTYGWTELPAPQAALMLPMGCFPTDSTQVDRTLTLGWVEPSAEHRARGADIMGHVVFKSEATLLDAPQDDASGEAYCTSKLAYTIGPLPARRRDRSGRLSICRDTVSIKTQAIERLLPDPKYTEIITAYTHKLRGAENNAVRPTEIEGLRLALSACMKWPA